MLLHVAVAIWLGTAPVSSPSRGAEQAVARFYQALCSQQWAQAAGQLHPSALRTMRDMLVYIAETTDDASERGALLSAFGVRSVAELRNLDGRVAVTRWFTGMWGELSEETRAMWRTSRASIIGSVREGAVYHVVVRTRTAISGASGAVVSVASAKKHDGEWKVLSTAQLDQMLQKLAPAVSQPGAAGHDAR